ncbi:hypothetical protein NE857_31610 [Nocardiopsis exhalans]|uniref:Uncharacterized protein n=1 Tax=Nocardiopsis exhalans TaxID=163604 RepID=A0ABY5D5R8_9ACTN|nr:hypothetical protein [Nocardiopsis exhalans]USY19727.1 hypothetical protein NE857_31610 [Nocardiopsis exhalans]
MAAEQITITRHSGYGATVTVDGIEIPANAIPAEGGLVVPVDAEGLQVVHLKLVARRVDVINALNTDSESETP